MSRIIYLLSAVLLAFNFTGCHTAETTPKGLVFYVSPKGSDNWSGRCARPNRAETDGPFQTIGKARDAIRNLKKSGSLNEPAMVMLDNGTYFQSNILVFTPEDSGTADCPITYCAYPDAKPVVSGGIELKGWEADHGEQSRQYCNDRLWKLQLPVNPNGGPWNFNQFYVKGEGRTRARSPNRGSFFRSDGPTGTNEQREFYFKEGDVSKWRNLRQALFVVYHSWETSLHHVHDIDTDAGIVTFREPAPWPMGRWEKQQRYYVEGIFEGLDQPGEWYLDVPAQILYYYPLPGEKPGSSCTVAPLLQSTLIAFEGRPAEEKFVEHIHFKGISFRHTDANLSMFRNPGQGEIYQKALVMAEGLRSSSFENCEISCAGAHAIWLAGGCTGTEIRQCHMHSLGGGGVYIGGGWGVSENVPAAGNTVDNCFIHNAGNLFHGAHGVWIGKSSYNRITHNEIKNLDYSGISCGWSWGFQPSSAGHNNIDFNYIHHLSNGEGLSDMGGIYTLGVSPGTTLRGNHLHDIYNYEFVSHGSGLYPDEGSSYILMEDNVVYRVRNSPLFMHYGADCTVRNNILALGDKGQLRRSREDKRCHYSAVGNIIYSNHPQMLDGPWKNKDWLVASNLYWCTTGEPLFAGRTFAQWQAEGNDAGSVVADPQFANPKAGDFRLRRGTPALKVGFKPIDLSKTGLYGEEKWVALPGKYPNRKLVEIAKPVAVPISVNYDFEDLQPGAKPLDAKVHESGGAVVSIVDMKAEAVAEVLDLGGGVMDPALQRGSQCLRFQDAPGLKFKWLPHLEYLRSYTNGTVRLSWDMLNSRELPADFSIELRDYSEGQYATGPSISVDQSGTVKANGVGIGTLPPETWTHVAIEITLNGNSPADYRVSLGTAGNNAVEKTIPLRDKRFRSITWLGIMTFCDRKAVYYLDNLKMGTDEELANPPKRRSRRRSERKSSGSPHGADMLSGHWSFDGNAGYTAVDSSGCGNDGEIWSRLAKGAFGTAALFDKGANHIRIPDAPAVRFGRENFSISLWIAPESLEISSKDPRTRFMDKNHFPETWWNMNLLTDGRVKMELTDSDKRNFGLTSKTALPVRQWTHLAITVDRNEKEAKVYINGRLDITVRIPDSFTGSLDVTGGDLSIGCNWQPFTGLIDEVKIHKRALTSEDIQKEQSKLKERYTDTGYQVVE